MMDSGGQAPTRRFDTHSHSKAHRAVSRSACFLAGEQSLWRLRAVQKGVGLL